MKKFKTLFEKFATKTSFCKCCFQEIKGESFHSLIYQKQYICIKCFYESNPLFHRFKIGKYHSLAIYEYDNFIKEKLYQLKGCKDIELAPIFLDYFRLYLKLKYHGYFVIGGPYHEDDLNERGFDQNTEIFKIAGFKVHHPILKKYRFKQSDLHKAERAEIYDKLEFVGHEDLKNKKVLIVDDVYTTGSTIKAMIKMLEKFQPKKIKILVLSYRTENKKE